jgi:hypothetical protein
VHIFKNYFETYDERKLLKRGDLALFGCRIPNGLADEIIMKNHPELFYMEQKNHSGLSFFLLV